MKYIIKNIIPAAALALALGVTSCTKDLDVDPIDPNLSTELNLDGLYLKCYANLALPGNGGANGDSDIDGYDLMSCQLMSRSAVGVTPVSLVSTSTSMTLPTR